LTGYDPYFIQNEFEMMQSDVILGKVIDALDLNQRWGNRYAGGGRLKTQETTHLLKSKLDLRPVRGTSLVEIRVRSDKPDEAAKIANAIAEAYITNRKIRREVVSRAGIKVMEERLREQEAKVKKAQQEVDKLRGELNISDEAASADSPLPMMTAETLRKLESLRIESKAEYVKARTLLERLKSLEKEVGTEVLASAITTAVPDTLLSSLQEQVNLAGGKLVALEKEFGPDHVEIIKCKAVLADLGERVKNRVNGIMLGLDARALGLSNSMENLDQEVETATRNDKNRVNQSRPYFEAKRNLEELQRFRQLLDMKLASEKVDAQLPKTASAEIVDRAVPALRPVTSNVRGALALIALGIFLDIVGLVMLKGRAGAGLAPRVA
ncbi:MAG: hypothetical protein NT154_08820, partial [Verrucomicrobia bacterium]|nr:hypothetical protein [Verrucomicrobiota bacterium]